jgi:hypothetical protein
MLKCKLSEKEAEECEYACVVRKKPDFDPYHRYRRTKGGLYACVNLNEGNNLCCTDKSCIECDDPCAVFLARNTLPNQKKPAIFCCPFLHECKKNKMPGKGKAEEH